MLLKEIINHEIVDFFAAFGSPGEPDIFSGEAQRKLIERLNPIISEIINRAESAESHLEMATSEIGDLLSEAESCAQVVRSQVENLFRANSIISQLRKSECDLQGKIETAKRAIDNLSAERDALRAQLAEMAKQEPVGYADPQELMARGWHGGSFMWEKSGTYQAPIFTRPAPPAPILLPRRQNNGIGEGWDNGYNAAIDDAQEIIEACGWSVADE